NRRSQTKLRQDQTRNLRLLWGIRVALHLTRPPEKPQELPLFLPEDIPEVASPHRICFLARISLKPPTQIRTPPRPQAVAARRIPEKPQLLAHFNRLT